MGCKCQVLASKCSVQVLPHARMGGVEGSKFTTVVRFRGGGGSKSRGVCGRGLNRFLGGTRAGVSAGFVRAHELTWVGAGRCVSCTIPTQILHVKFDTHMQRQ